MKAQNRRHEPSLFFPSSFRLLPPLCPASRSDLSRPPLSLFVPSPSEHFSMGANGRMKLTPSLLSLACLPHAVCLSHSVTRALSLYLSIPVSLSFPLPLSLSALITLPWVVFCSVLGLLACMTETTTGPQFTQKKTCRALFTI